MTTVGILGGGQLGRFLAMEAKPLGLRTVVLDPVVNGPAAQICDAHIAAPIDDQSAALELARRSDVVTFEWELIASELLERLSKEKPVRPGPSVLRTIQDRLVQKEFIRSLGLPQAPYKRLDAGQLLPDALKELGLPCILKRRRHGYDGKGQARLNQPADVEAAVQTLEQPCVVERQVELAKELSVILTRDLNGKLAVFPVAENLHRNGILHTTVAPARIPEAVALKATATASQIAVALSHVGTLAVEFFLTKAGELLVNEIAPRVHNSGHYTLDACATSQFSQHLRAVCGLPLGSTEQSFPAVMINVLGDIWSDGEPRWERLMRRGDARLHLYGKAKPAPGRKMGHIIILGDSERALNDADSLLDALRR